MKAHLDPPEPPRWSDLSISEQVHLCCDLIRVDCDFLADALTDATSEANIRVFITALRTMNDAALGKHIREVVVDTCRSAVTERLENGKLVADDYR